MALLRWQPFSELENLRRQMDQVFDDINGMTGIESNNPLGWQPAIELSDRDNNLILRAQIPGLNAEDLDISVSRDTVTLKGEHRQEDESQDQGFYRSEFRYGSFQRTINLPVAVENDQVEAEFNNGVLTLTLPKVEEAKDKVVKINLGSNKQEQLQ
ncbi:Hsp20/alpha crystallin family protein [Spirulina sp. CS-785/01]|uniref:Hsp20/alpha crystallin family protein n=1 Tax=Spirulina sp. CS-785/01 TaxID=3021716 RepID=UPI00232DC326|nr:Hsp20/alpha crystallin family protein [Spirulina sp. CS-785/01]MDB9312099.1 Hsp20/alpha crystallin family protein [Spirulina sp. CS-785/01]